MTAPVRFHNTLANRVEDFTPREAGKVTIYTCGPTVYRYIHIGNFRSFLLGDLLVRSLRYLGYDVTQVRNITDVGHLQDDEGAAGGETGEDKLVAQAQAEGKTPKEIADFYTRAFHEDAELLHVTKPTHEPRATDFVPDMIQIIKKLEGMEMTYAIEGNVYYDVEMKKDYGKLSNNTLEALKAGHRVEVDQRKHHPADFLLWKAAGQHRLQVWDSPWGVGFPGWHIECSAMSLHYFPQGFDIHTGGEDNIFPHHEDEIAQSEPVLGHPPANYWMHGGFLQFGGLKMSRSKGNVLRITDLEDPLAYRWLCLTAKYRAKLSFTDESYLAARRGLASVRQQASRLEPAAALESEQGRAFEQRFRERIADDLDLPGVLALIHELLRSDVPSGEKRGLLEGWDQVLAVDITKEEAAAEAPAEVMKLVEERESARKAKDFARSDALRKEIAELGWAVEDSPAGPKVKAVR